MSEGDWEKVLDSAYSIISLSRRVLLDLLNFMDRVFANYRLGVILTDVWNRGSL